jgi:hypothetical protein
MKRNIVLGLVGVIVLLVISGCSSPSSPTTPTTPAYVGTWKGSDSSFSYSLVLTASTFKYTDTLNQDGSTLSQAAPYP